MRKQTKILVLALATLCMLTGCAGKEEEKTKVVLPEPTEKTIVLKEEKLQIENISPYDGIYIEKGDDENKDRVEGVYALSFTNTSEQTIEKATLVFSDGTQELNFYMEMVPYGHTVTVVEYDKKAVKSGDLEPISCEISYLQDALEDQDGFELIESDYGSCVLENKTGQELQKAEIYYRRAYENGTLGGICYKEVLEDVIVDELVFANPVYWSDKCAIVNTLIYPEVGETN